MDYSYYFKKCHNCGYTWTTRDDFLSDTDLELIGYQVSFLELSTGLFYFNHSCGGTLVIQAQAFKYLYNGPIFQKRFWGEDECPEYCLYRDELAPCPNECECAYIREIIQIIRKGQERL